MPLNQYKLVCNIYIIIIDIKSFLLNFFILITCGENYTINIYGKLGVKSFTFLYDLSNESQNFTKKDMPLYMAYLLVFNYLIVVSCLNIKAG